MRQDTGDLRKVLQSENLRKYEPVKERGKFVGREIAIGLGDMKACGVRRSFK